jgi:sulfonate transport system substrate-binding protein
MKRRHLLSLIAAAPAGIALAQAGFAQSAPTTFRIGWQKGGILALAKASAAIETKLAERGIAVEWSEFTSGPPLLEALGANALDFGSTGDVPPLFAQAAGGDLVYVAASKGSKNGSAILVKQSSPIQSLADLKGKKVAFKRGSSSHNFIVKALRTAGLTLDDIEAFDLGPSDAAPAFSTDQVDAWVIWDPYFAIAEQDPTTRVLVTTDGIVDSWGFYQANGAFARDHADIVAEVIAVLKQVGEAAQTNLDATISQISQITGVPEPIQRIALTRDGADLGGIFPITDETIVYQQALADEFFALGIIPRQLTISDIVWYAPAG